MRYNSTPPDQVVLTLRYLSFLTSLITYLYPLFSPILAYPSSLVLYIRLILIFPFASLISPFLRLSPSFAFVAAYICSLSSSVDCCCDVLYAELSVSSCSVFFISNLPFSNIGILKISPFFFFLYIFRSHHMKKRKENLMQEVVIHWIYVRNSGCI